MQKTILLTGGTGFLGSNLLNRLVADGHNVILAKRSTSDLSRIQPLAKRLVAYDLDKQPYREIFENHPIQMIVHCATNYGRSAVPFTEILEANLILPLALIQLGSKYGVRAFINADTILDKRVSEYSLSKKQFLDWLPSFSKNLVCANVALEHFFGPFDDASKFVTRTIVDLLSGIESINFTPGEQRRDFIYIDDVVEAFVKVIEFASETRAGIHRFEVGTGNVIRIKDFVELAKELCGNRVTQLRFGALPYRENEVMESKVDTSELEKLGWKAKIELMEGLKRTIEFEKGRIKK